MTAPVVLITGAARRVGAAIARHLHGRGANVAIHCRSSLLEADGLARQLNQERAQSAAVFQADLLDIPALASMVEAVVARFGALDALVNNASSFFSTPIGSIGQAEWDDLVGSNLKGPLFLSQAAAPHLKQRRGAIINITDVHAERPLRNHAVYCVAKAGLLGLTRSLAIDLAPDIRVNAVAPGAIEWPEEGESFPEEERSAIVASTLLKRVGTPSDIARAVAFLILDAPYVTGQVLNVDGGRTAHLS